MIVKIYGMLWLATGVIAALLYIAGVFTLTVGVTFEFIAFGMVFMGMIGVLPILAAHPSPPRSAPEQTKATTSVPEPSPLGKPGHAVHA